MVSVLFLVAGLIYWMVLALLAYPTNMNAYSQLCNLLTTGNLRAEKGECHLYKADVYQYAKGYKIYCTATCCIK